MEKKSKLDRLPNTIKTELIERVLSENETLIDMRQWLLDQHGICISKTALWRFAKAYRLKYGGLIKLGMPITHIILNLSAIDAMGIVKVQQQLNEKLTREANLFSYLDEARQ